MADMIYIGTALTQEARTQLGLRGYAPVGVENLELQKTRALNQLRSKATDLEKYTFMAQLRNSNTRLFYKLVCDDIKVNGDLVSDRLPHVLVCFSFV